MSDFAITGLDEIAPRDTRIPVRDHFGILGFGVNAYRSGEEGDVVISEHTESMVKHEELYVVVEGHATFTLDGNEVDAPAGTLVFAQPRTRRRALARLAGTTVLAVGARSGHAYEVAPWEEAVRENEEAMTLYREKRYDEAAEVLRRAIAQRPDAAGLVYNLACVESLGGAAAASVAHDLARAIELHPPFVELAREDADLDRVRDDPAIAALLGRAEDQRADEGLPMSQAARLDAIPAVDDRGREWRRVRMHFGITAFGVNAWTARETGDIVINVHDESEPDSQEELYLVLRGSATFELGNERFDAPAGTLVFVRPGLARGAVAAEPGTTVIALGGTPGRPYVPFGWEVWAPLHPLYEAGEYAEAADRGAGLVEANPDSAGLLYNLACCEALAGRTDAAIDHLGRAIGVAEQCRSYATGDSDFDVLRDDPRFVALVGTAPDAS